MANVLLTEFYKGHLELINSHIEMLISNGHSVHLCLNELSKCQKYEFRNIKKLFYISYDKSPLSQFRAVRDINLYIEENNIDKVVINTAEGRFVALYSLFARKNINITGTLHHINKVNNSFQQKIINMRIKKYFVLSDLLYKSLEQNDKLNFKAFYPVFFPEAKKNINKNGFHVCVPGGFDQKRKDLSGLIDSVCREKHKIESLEIKFILLGNINGGNGPEILDKIKSNKLENKFICFEGFVTPETFYEYLCISDIVLPLIHKKIKGFNEYTSSRISGTFNSAFGFKKPMLMEKSFSSFNEFKDVCLFYKEEDLVDSIIEIYNNRKILEEKTNRIENDIRFDYNFQKDNYAELLNL